MSWFSISNSICAFIFAVSAGMSSAATLQVNASGQLTGATDVTVNGTSYNVEFFGGTCIDGFSGCEDAGDFEFNSASDALAAANALMNEVFADSPLGNFDSNPILTNGCDHFITCRLLTPYASDGSLASVAWFSNDQSDNFDHTRLGLRVISQSNRENVWARWSTNSVTPVPVPASMPLLFLGLAGLVALRRK